jgi:hypothetical protein
MLPGGPYAELSEVRRRTRFAVLSGLERRDYTGETQDHIGCWNPKGIKGHSIPYEIPYELFQQKEQKNPAEGNDNPKEVLVLWLNEDLFARSLCKAS